MTSPTTHKPLIHQTIRFLVYAIAAVLLAEFIRFDARFGSVESKFSESSYTEYLQSLFLFTSSILLFITYRKSPTKNYVALLLFGLTVASFIREQDIYFETYIGKTTWFYPVLVVLAFSLYGVIKNGATFLRQLNQYRQSFSAGLFTFGFITTYIFSRLFGRKVFWYAVMEDHYVRGVKNAAEECLELYGYLIILIAVIEFYLLRTKKTA
ncbi:hypothetical protein GCM10023231_40720 [Olivibacter ginsenosidimutans]|uniref:Uncharacterized protein n=1 Tax=Olivibacter ginsenosidimutans TaxID=1176537 RepID=A0ABP9CG88_9SPHI